MNVKLIQSSKLTKEVGFLVFFNIDFYDFISLFIPKFLFRLRRYFKRLQTLETVFLQLSKHLEFHQKYSIAHCILNSLLGVWIS